jgi:predicted nucleotidyltransferase component of viral defense system
MKLGRQAKELGFVRDTYEKVCRLADVLAFFERDPLLSHTLVLKGGTAINLTIFSLPRLSVDIDLDFAENLPRDKTLEQRQHISERIEKHMAASGYVLSPKTRTHHALDSYVYEYINAGNMKDNLKIEINYMMRTHVLPLSRRPVSLPWLENDMTVLCLDPTEIFASKIVALINRAAPRDLYDIHLMQANRLFNDTQMSLLRKCVMLYCAIGSKTLQEAITFGVLNQMSQFRIKTDLAPVLRQGDFFDLHKTREAVVRFLEKSLVPDKSEAQFWDEFRQNRYKPELLFDDPCIVTRIANHPMAAWKCREHVRPSVIKPLLSHSVSQKDKKPDTEKVRKQDLPER